MPAWATAIFSAIAAIPEIVKMLAQLVERIDALIEYQQIKHKAKEFKDALDRAKATKDTSELERILNP